MFSRPLRLEQQALLKHHAYLPAQSGGIDHRQVYASDQHAPAFGRVLALNQLGERDLPEP